MTGSFKNMHRMQTSYYRKESMICWGMVDTGFKGYCKCN